MGRGEAVVDWRAPMPRGYGFLRKGSAYRTGLCRRLTHASGQTLFVVKRNKAPIGLWAPREIVNQVFSEDEASRETRREALERRDASGREAFRRELAGQFPAAPSSCADSVISHTLRKRSGRVGRTGKLGLEAKTRLAVVAHIRHRHTEYEGLLEAGGMSRPAARSQVQGEVDRVLGKWQQGHGAERGKRRGPGSGGIGDGLIIAEATRVEEGGGGCETNITTTTTTRTSARARRAERRHGEGEGQHVRPGAGGAEGGGGGGQAASVDATVSRRATGPPLPARALTRLPTRTRRISISEEQAGDPIVISSSSEEGSSRHGGWSTDEE